MLNAYLLDTIFCFVLDFVIELQIQFMQVKVAN